MPLNLLQIKTKGNEYKNVRATETLTLPTDTSIPADKVGSTRFNPATGSIETWDGGQWVSGGGGTGGTGILIDPNL